MILFIEMSLYSSTIVILVVATKAALTTVQVLASACFAIQVLQRKPAVFITFTS